MGNGIEILLIVLILIVIIGIAFYFFIVNKPNRRSSSFFGSRSGSVIGGSSSSGSDIGSRSRNRSSRHPCPPPPCPPPPCPPPCPPKCIPCPGAQGPRGCPGPQGYQGRRGRQGDLGPRGPIGPMGERGITGPTGLTGAQGPQGLRGLRGFQGFQGFNGLPGAQGPQGFIGFQGPLGPQGAQGAVGTALGGIIPYSTEGIVFLEPMQSLRFMYSIGFGFHKRARFLENAAGDFSNLYIDVGFSVPRAVVLRRLTVTINGRVGVNQTPVPTVPAFIGNMIFRIYIVDTLSPTVADIYRATSMEVVFVGNDAITSPRTATSALMSIPVPLEGDVALVLLNTVDLSDDPNFSLDLNVSAGLLYD